MLGFTRARVAASETASLTLATALMVQHCVAAICHAAGMDSPRRTVIIVSCIAVSVFAVCGLGAAALVWAALNTPTPVEQQVGEAAPALATTQPSSASTSSSAPPATIATTSATTTAPASGFDRAAWDTYWATFAQTSYGLHVTDVTWSGIAFIAHTDLVADSDARTPATQICMAASGFWAPGFRPIQVYDRNETVLVSRRSQGEACEWRR